MFESVLGLDSGINLVYGESATGKTTLCLQIAGEKAINGKVVFIDTENGFSLERFKQIYPEDYKERLNNINLARVSNFDEQCKVFDTIKNVKKVDLVIVDTIGMHYRERVKEDSYDANKKIDKQLKILKELFNRDVKVIISNQVYSNITTNKIQVVGGNMLRNWSSVVMKMEKNPRKIIKEKPKEEIIEFKIDNKGITLIS